MTYFQGFVVPVKPGNKQAYLDVAKRVAPVFAEYGATRTVECWGDDVMEGKVTDFLTGKLVNDTPEEYVRQNIEKALVRQYKYAPKDCEPENW